MKKKHINSSLFFLLFTIITNNGIKASEEQNQKNRIEEEDKKLSQAIEKASQNPETLKIFEKLSKEGFQPTDKNFLKEVFENLSQEESQSLLHIAFQEMKKTLYPDDPDFSFETFQKYAEILRDQK